MSSRCSSFTGVSFLLLFPSPLSHSHIKPSHLHHDVGLSPLLSSLPLSFPSPTTLRLSERKEKKKKSCRDDVKHDDMFLDSETSLPINSSNKRVQADLFTLFLLLSFVFVSATTSPFFFPMIHMGGGSMLFLTGLRSWIQRY